MQRVAIVNRGAAASRFVTSARELAGITTIALYGDADRRAMFVRDADESFALGPAGLGDLERLGEALRRSRADAAWVGWGALAADPGLAELCAQLGVTFIGPRPEALRRAAASRRVAPPGARCLEVQLCADRHGAVWVLGTRERHDAIVEAPATLSPAEDAALREAALRHLAGCDGVVTVELAAHEGRIEPLALRPHLTAEHAVTEVTTGVDLVKLQLLVAGDGRLVGPAPAERGHAVGARLDAIEPDRGFLAAPAKLERFRLAGGAGVRVDSGYDRDDEVPAGPDATIAHVVAAGQVRDEAHARLYSALRASTLVLRGGASNKGFLLEQLVKLGGIDAGAEETRRGTAVAVVLAAVEGYDAASAVEQQQFARSAARGRPVAAATAGTTVELAHRGHAYTARVRRVAGDRYEIAIDGARLEVTLEPLAAGELRLAAAGQRFRVVSLAEGAAHIVEVDGVPHRVGREGPAVVRAPAPGVVVAVAVAPGDVVALGDRLVVVEAMKSYSEIGAAVAGRVREVLVVPNMQVAPGGPLLVIDTGDGAAVRGASGPRLAFDVLAGAPRGGWRGALEDLRSLVLGYDVDAGAVRRALLASAGDAPPERLALEDEVLEVFVDSLALFRRRSAHPSEEEGTRSSATEHLHAYLRDLTARGAGLPASFLERLRRALAHYGVGGLERTPALHEALFRIIKARGRLEEQVAPVLAVLARRIDAAEREARDAGDRGREILDRLIFETHGQLETVCDHARELRYRAVERALLDASRRRLLDDADAHLAVLDTDLPPDSRRAHIAALAAVPHPLLRHLSSRLPAASATLRGTLLQVLVSRYYGVDPAAVRVIAGAVNLGVGDHQLSGRPIRVIAAHEEFARLDEALDAAAREAERAPGDCYTDLYLWDGGGGERADAIAARVVGRRLPAKVRGVVIAVSQPERVLHLTLRNSEGGLVEERDFRGLHPVVARRLALWRLAHFELERLPSSDEVFLFRASGRENREDVRLVALAEVRDITPVRDAAGRLVSLPHLERVLAEALDAMRLEQLRRPARERLHWNRVQLFVRPALTLPPAELETLVRRLAPSTSGLGLERVLVRVQIPDEDGGLTDRVIDLFNPGGGGVTMVVREPPSEPMTPLSPYLQKVIRARQQGLSYPYEIVAMLTSRGGAGVSGFPPGEFIEHDLDDGGELVPVARPPGENRANVVVGVIRNFTALHPEGMARVILLGDPSKEMGSLAEPECRRINAALALATRLGVPVEWFALSAGAKIAIDSGSENMDWIALTLRRIIELTQRGGEINVVVDGINVGAQPYFNAEATMLLHTRGILIMTHQGAMVLTGKRALDYSGGVSADDNSGIGGYERIMGPNGQAQYHAADLPAACRILLAHYEHTYVAPGERFPRRAPTRDPFDRDVLAMPHAAGLGFTTVGEIFSDAHNPGRKRPFDVRSVLAATIDQDHPPLERWFGWRGAEMAVAWDAHLGGYPVCLLGIESRPLPRLGMVPADGPEQYTPGTLFPQASKKLARAINTASGNRPVVVLANLTGFDGSPESMRERQLEYGAEIGRAVVNFRGPLVFCVISRYHGGAFVVFSAKLNDDMEVAALEGSYASVIGGAPAAAVVFQREVERRARRDPRVAALDEELARAEPPARAGLTARRAEVWKAVHSEMLGKVAEEFDRVHSVQRAQRMGSVHEIIAAASLRSYLIAAVERGIARTGAY